MNGYHFLDEQGTFSLDMPENYSCQYFPVADEQWNDDYGSRQKTADGDVYYGTVLEHLLVQNLCAFYEVGGHNHCRLRGADGNDALDMAECLLLYREKTDPSSIYENLPPQCQRKDNDG